MDNVIINIAEKSDIKEILEIYSYYVLNSPATFEIDIPDINEFSLQIEKIQNKYPYLTAKINGKTAGYAYAAPLRTRKAYDYSCETTIYLHHKYFNNCGYKHNTWHDILWLEKIIGSHKTPPAPFINFNDLKL